MRAIFRATRRPRPWVRWVYFPFLLARWVVREMREGADELWDEHERKIAERACERRTA
jgi:hypothetical protein